MVQKNHIVLSKKEFGFEGDYMELSLSIEDCIRDSIEEARYFISKTEYIRRVHEKGCDNGVDVNKSTTEGVLKCAAIITRRR